MDERFLRRALELAALGRYTAPPNPAVGAVLVRGGRVLAEGFHARTGGPHAEAQVLSAAPASRGATLYVNLEPCCHVGRTPPCVERIIASGVARVVAAHADPDPRVSGGGFRRLRAAGIEVRTGVLKEEAEALNAPFFQFLRSGRPLVTVKAAISADGVMAPPGTKWITRPRSRRHGRVLRRENDALLTGIATVAADDPRMTARPRRGARPLLRVVLDPNLRIAPEARILEGRDRDPVLVVASPAAPAAARRRLARRGVEVFDAPLAGRPAAARRAALALGPVLSELGRRGVHTLLVEAGPRLTSAFLEEGLADRLFLYMAPRFLGRGDGTGLFDAVRAARSPTANRRVRPASSPDRATARYACVGRDLLMEFRLRGLRFDEAPGRRSAGPPICRSADLQIGTAGAPPVVPLGASRSAPADGTTPKQAPLPPDPTS